MSIFEIMMLLCFGAAWPVSIYKSYTSRRTNGKSGLFLVIIVLGYISGIIHKFVYSFDNVIYLYMLNVSMVSIDIILFLRNKKIEKEKDF
ncbi:MAG TPA: hypothetical protein DDW93_12215 [Firmicutes bacterium]|jgi:hypothetical protein|nr:hypothetical protein [Bacillota bacterium]HBK67052.1 hypothetical protein [Bacillota bacterium]